MNEADERCTLEAKVERLEAEVRRMAAERFRVGGSSRPPRRGALVVGVAALCALPAEGLAVDPPDAFPFQMGTPISADDVNATFQTLYDAVTALEPRSVRYSSSSGQSIPNNVYTVVDYSTADFDNGDMEVETGASWAFTAPADGVYRVSASAHFAQTVWGVGQSGELRVFVGGTLGSVLDYEYVTVTTPGNYFLFLAGTDLVRLNMGQALDVRVYQNTGAALGLYTDADANHIAIERVE